VQTGVLSGLALADSPLLLVDVALRLLRVLVLLALWRTLLATPDGAEPGPMSLATVLTYTVVVEQITSETAGRYRRFCSWTSPPSGWTSSLDVGSSGSFASSTRSAGSRWS
jgi:hypothetical protein